MTQPVDTDAPSLQRYRSFLYLLARAHLKPHAGNNIEASDLVQQTLLDAHARRDQFRGTSEAQLGAWLKQILANNLADAIRHQGRAKRDVSRQRPLDAAIDDSFCRAESWLAGSQTSPSQFVAKKEELLSLADAIAKLPAAQQEAVILHHLQGLKLAEVAAQMQRTEPAVAGLLYRGIKQLHKMLENTE